MGLRVVRVVVMQNSSQSSPVSRMKLVISRKACGTLRRVGGAWFWNGLFWLGVVAEGKFLRGVKWEGGRGAGRMCMLRFFGDCVGGQDRFLCIMCFLVGIKGS